MEKQVDITENISKFLTNERFELGQSKVKKRLNQLKDDGLIDDNQFEKIQEEDFVLTVKYKTYKKCLRQIIVGLILTGIGFGLMNTSSLRYLFIVSGIILSISSFFGILSNRLSKEQLEYLKK